MSILSEAKKARACSNGYSWWEKNHDFELCAKEHTGWYLWGYGKCPSWEKNTDRLDKCAESNPCSALEYAAKLLTTDRLDKCAASNPGYALEYAAKLLTADRLDKIKGVKR